MKTLIDVYLAILDSASVGKAEDHASLWAEYATILRRADHPRGGDAERLAQLVKSLALDPREPMLHVAALADFKRLATYVDAIADHQRELTGLNTQVVQLEIDREKVISRLQAVAQQRDAAAAKLRHAQLVAQGLDAITGAFPGLFENAPPAGDSLVTFRKHMGTPAVAELARSLGLL